MTTSRDFEALIDGINLLGSGVPSRYETLDSLIGLARDLVADGYDADALAYLILGGAMDAGCTESEALRIIRAGLEVTNA